MPYIPIDRRLELNDPSQPREIKTPGELNFVLTLDIEEYRHTHGDSYQTFNDIIGALEGAKQEFYRRIVSPYEDKKIKENYDVYTELEE